MRHDLLADTMSTIKNAEKAGKKECLISPTSKLTVNTLNIMKKEGFIKSLKFKETSKGGQIEVELIGRINQCKAIRLLVWSTRHWLCYTPYYLVC